MVTTWTFNVTPLGKPRMTQRDKWAKRPCVMRYFAYADELRNQAQLQDFQLCNGLYYAFHLPMPTSWNAKKRAMKVGSLHDEKPDIDNLLKGFMDSCAKEDKAIASITGLIKLWAYEPKVVIIKQ